MRDYSEPMLAPTSVQKIEPKVFFANERTFLHWLHHGIVLASVASGVLAFAGDNMEDGSQNWAHWYALVLLALALAFVSMRYISFYGGPIASRLVFPRIPGRWDDPRGPMFLGGILAIVLTINFVVQIYEIATYVEDEVDEDGMGLGVGGDL
eukprot:CAMPEP_0194071326 /NCGR_PEP_ID=MMETSP0009_2-20130614/88649_1 /TAXON_ID=210454 /ORGANISM="Grammatophora oceanica, Strain CCMP 410" /LENGTH=151 /DNA_ID=CAMNT_0038724641 /DNA_START=50 /DNA_END=506 /DNA_ORIENTATION=-